MRRSLTYSFCTVNIYHNFIVVVINSGEHLTPDYNAILLDIVEKYFKDRPFVYLTHRKNSYSVDPAIYLQTSKIETLAGFGVIAEVPVSKGNAEVEKLFLNKPFEIFKTLDDAIVWANEITQNEPEGS